MGLQIVTEHEHVSPTPKSCDGINTLHPSTVQPGVFVGCGAVGAAVLVGLGVDVAGTDVNVGDPAGTVGVYVGGICVPVGDGVSVGVGVRIWVVDGDTVGVLVKAGVKVGVNDEVAVLVGVGVTLDVGDGDAVGVLVKVGVRVGVNDEVGVLVGVGVTLGVGDGVKVGKIRSSFM